MAQVTGAKGTATKKPGTDYSAFGGLTAELIAHRIDFDHRATREVHNLASAKQLWQDAYQVNLQCVVADPLARAREAEAEEQIERACGWLELYHVHRYLNPEREESDNPETSPLRAFVVKYGLVETAEEYFDQILTVEEWLDIATEKYNASGRHTNHLYDTFNALNHCSKEHSGRIDLLDGALALALGCKRIDLAETAAEMLGRKLTKEQVGPIVENLISSAQFESYIVKAIEIVKQYELRDHKGPLLDAAAKYQSEEMVRAWMKDLDMNHRKTPIKILFERATHSKNILEMVRLGQELGERIVDLRSIYADAKTRAIAQDFPLDTIDEYAEKAGAPLTIEELLAYWKGEHRIGAPKRPEDAQRALKRASEKIFALSNP